MIHQDRKRLFIFIIFASICLIPLLFRLASLMLFSPQTSKEANPATQIEERGPILDRNGKILAIETKLKSVTAWVPDIDDIEETVKIVSEACGMEKKDVSRILKGSNGFAFIKRKVKPQTSDKIAEIKKAGKLRGINLEDEYSRIYPQGSIGSHLVGYVDVDERGLDGVERTFEDELAPATSENDDDRGNAVSGNQVFLTIDINLQFAIEDIAKRAFAENKADAVLAVVADAKTGEILSYCSIPSFDPNDVAHSTLDQRINHIATQSYEPGSVFKVFSIASFIELGGISKDDEFHCNGSYDKIRDPIKCQTSHGNVTPLEIIKYSCNVGAAYASENVSQEAFYKLLSSWGFGTKTRIELPGETAGILNPVSRWSSRSKPAIAFGQEISVSAIQIVQAATALTNGGIMLKPLIVKKIVSPAGRLIKEYSRFQLKEVISPGTAWLMLQMMKSTTTGNGSARLASVEGVSVSAKTGTAEVYDPKAKRYSDTNFTSSILGIFPTDDPQYIIYTVIQNPRGEIYSSRIAAPLFREMAEKVISILKLTTGNTRVIEHPQVIEIKAPEEITLGSVMPDLKGVPKRRLLPLFGREDIMLLIKGEGNVVNQSPAPGAKVTAGMKIVLELE